MIGILPNPHKPEALEVARQLARWCQTTGEAWALPPDGAAAVGHPEWGRELAEWSNVRVVVVLGGDGTFLQAAKECAPLGFPLVGVNLGRVGFLTEVEVSSLYRAVSDVLQGKLREERRMMLEARVERGGSVLWRSLALNEVVMAKGPFARMAHIVVEAGERRVATYRGDGLIVSTATGSTGYALSAGGPILSPELEIILLTPICPHSLTIRPLVLGAHERIRVMLASPHVETLLTVDGQRGVRIRPGDDVVVERSPVYTRLLRPRDRDFYGLLRSKLAGEEGREEAD